MSVSNEMRERCQEWITIDDNGGLVIDSRFNRIRVTDHCDNDWILLTIEDCITEDDVIDWDSVWEQIDMEASE